MYIMYQRPDGTNVKIPVGHPQESNRGPRASERTFLHTGPRPTKDKIQTLL